MASHSQYRKLKAPFQLSEVMLSGLDKKGLAMLGAESGTGLSVEELQRIASYFKKRGRNPTDVELQSIGQAWSEHCCYKSSKLILKEFVLGIDNEDVIDRGDAGVMNFDTENAYSLRIESHNHPSAVEPYGGAATGIGGIVRDVLCMGCQPVALIDPLFFGTLDKPRKAVPKGTKHPRYLFSGVVAGIRDYGNRIGIPTVGGGVYFDDSYLGNCLVNVGCVGISRKRDLYRNRVGGVGDNLILVGGRTGRDGIHGVTFASAVLTDKSETESRGAVQLGDPIMKEPLIHAVLEVGRRKLITGMKDLGGGGLSCVCGELAYAAGFGVEVHLDKVPLKEEGLSPWEIWVSESQERMMLAVRNENVEEVLHVFKFYDVPATAIGKVIKEKSAKVFFKKVKVLDLDLEFLTGGPVYCRPRKMKKPSQMAKEKPPKEPKDYSPAVLELLASHNICSKDWVIRQYDHEVRGSTILKPLQGVVGHDSHGNAVVLKPVENSWKGLALATSANPWAAAIDPHRGGKGIVDELCRNLASVGARPHSFTNCLNFGNPEKPEVMGEFHETVRGMGEVSEFLNLPIPSGNVSFYNESLSGSVLPTAVILGAGLLDDCRKAISSDIKKKGSWLYLVGETKNEMGASAYYRLVKASSAKVPDVNAKVLKNSLEFLLASMKRGLISSCHDVSHGGLAVTVSEMCIGGQLGAELDLEALGKLRPDIKLFSESNTRWVAEVDRMKAGEFERLAGSVPVRRLGETGGKTLAISDAGRELVSLKANDLEKAWRSPLWRAMGGE